MRTKQSSPSTVAPVSLSADKSLLARRESLERKLSRDLGAAEAAAAGSAVLRASPITRSVSAGDVEQRKELKVRGEG